MKWTLSALGAGTVLAAAGFFLYTPSTEDYVRPFVSPPGPATIIFGGDMMFDRTIRTTMEEKGDDYVFSCIAEFLKDADIVVANLEGPITSHASKSVDSEIGGEGNFNFTFPTTTAELLARHNIRLVNLGNNHIMNFGREGLFETKKWLEEADVRHFGDPDLPESERVERMEIRDIPISFVNWSDWTSDKTDHTVAQVRTEVQAGRLVFVYTHWGEEYVPPLPQMKQLARSFVDAGASIVIGSHPHIVQEHERYQGKDIYYSLGNFVFDQYWSEAVRRGLLLRVSFNPTDILSVEEIPIDNRTDRRTCAV